MADFKEPQLRNSTRWDYMSRYLPAWIQARQSRTYAIVTAVIGVLLLLRGQSTLSVFPFAAASYFYTRAGLQNFILNSQRKLITAE